jgi:sigma-B regulation protein RsbU (phosphoserine phosphatase)
VKILVADDQALGRTCLSDALGEWGYEVVCAVDGEDAWRQICDDPEIAILVTDWTLLYGILELRTLRFRYARAGHPGPLRVRAGQASFHVEGGGIPIGIDCDAVYRDDELQLERGDLLLLFTDGAHETMSESSEEFGIDRLREAAGAGAGLGAAGAIESLRSRLDGHRKQEPQRDDVTLLAVEIDPSRG